MDVNGQLHNIAALHVGKFLCYALNSQLDEPQNSSGCSEEEGNLFVSQETP